SDRRGDPAGGRLGLLRGAGDRPSRAGLRPPGPRCGPASRDPRMAQATRPVAKPAGERCYHERAPMRRVALPFALLIAAMLAGGTVLAPPARAVDQPVTLTLLAQSAWNSEA